MGSQSQVLGHQLVYRNSSFACTPTIGTPQNDIRQYSAMKVKYLFKAFCGVVPRIIYPTMRAIFGIPMQLAVVALAPHGNESLVYGGWSDQLHALARTMKLNH